MFLLRLLNIADQYSPVTWREASPQLDAEMEEQLLQEALQFRLAGGTLSPNEWEELVPLERQVLAAAGEKLIGHQGLASQTDLAAASLLGFEAHAQVAAKHTMENVRNKHLPERLNKASSSVQKHSTVS